MSVHEKAEHQILFDRASNFIVAHATAAGLDLLPPIWDGGAPSSTLSMHHVRITTREGEVDLAVPHEWLPVDSKDHNRFRTEVEAALAQLGARRRSPQ